MSNISDIQNKFQDWLKLYFPHEVTNDSERSNDGEIENASKNKTVIADDNSETNVNNDDSENIQTINTQSNNTSDDISDIPTGFIQHPVLKNGSMKVFENDSFIIYVQKAIHQRQKKFKYQDSLFHIKIEQKDNSKTFLLRNLLETFEQTFKYILDHLKLFFNLDDHNVAYLTLYQDSFINGLNTGGFDLQENADAAVDHLLGMLQQFLTSNQDLSLNKSFKVYINVLSIDHMKYRLQNPNKRKVVRRSTKIARKRFGIRKNTSNDINNKYQNFWSIDIPQSYIKKHNIFYNKCLLLCCILGHYHYEYFENTRNKTFLRLQYITSTREEKQMLAVKTLQKELEKLENSNVFANLNNVLDHTDFNEIGPIISKFYNCQLIIFSGKATTTKIIEM